ncbi:non-ribosomal peptide synthetase [Ruegeria sp. HKCCA5491]|uniref:non-ribosomal peptide synthetase n=1 Tax=Ruegeria sp. HKCCA5491 TaxID=2682986 RepID=UPI0014876394|nr:non-ribosomal peptide synthetase [Ruegeria sp. HKCCA5491]
MGLPKGVADILPLTPAQQGMLFHTVGEAALGGQYVAVISCALNGPLDPNRLKRAFKAMLAGRDALHAGFVWEGVKQPVQAVREEINLPWTELDWSGVRNVDQRWDDLLRLEQIRRFDLKKPPLMAVTLIKLSDSAWRLVWTAHHLISDGWSTRVALQDVCASYRNPNAVRDQAPSFKSYLIWQRKQKNLTNRAFWTDQFSGLTEPSTLQTTATSSEAALQERRVEELGHELMTSVENLARQLKVTSNVILSAAWGLTLRRLLQQDDVVFGTTTSGRPPEIPGIAKAIGAFVNTLPVRCKFDPAQPVENFLLDHARSDLARRKHEYASLAKVQSCAPFTSGTPLFDTLFVNEGLAQLDLDLGDVDMTRLKTTQFSNYPLTLLVTPQDRLTVELYHDPSSLSSEDVESVITDYKDILSAITNDPKVAVKNLLRQAQDAMKPSPEPDSEDVIERFLSCARNSPQAVAISDGEATLTYAELSLGARKIAKALVDAGVKTTDIVPVALPRGSAAISAFLGVMMSGAAYVPLDLDYPSERISQVLNAIEARHIVTDQIGRTKLPETGAHHVLLSSLGNPMDSVDVRRGERAYVMFTSGSQSLPKGVEITRRGLALSTAARDTYYKERPSVFLLLSSLAFDSSVAGIYWTLCTGGQLVIAPRRAEQEPLKLGKLISHHRVTHTLCLPGLAQALLSAVPSRDLESLRTVITAGEPLHPTIVRQFRTVLPGRRLVNEYGPTEATVWCTAYDATSHVEDADIPIGSAIPGTWVGVVDADDCPVSAGKIGEIVVAGRTVARGYLNNAIQTQERFFHTGLKDIQAYRTGDLGIADASGHITFLGRKDSQVKIRGHRVELSEIETAASTVTPNQPVAAVVLDQAASKSIAIAIEGPADEALCQTVSGHIQATLPSPFHPNLVVNIERFPQLPNGKTDLQTLARMVSDVRQVQVGDPPEGELEGLLAELFSDVLRTACTTRDANFFDIGGDSLTTIAAYAKGQEMGLEFEPTDLFSCPTVAELAKRITDRMTSVTFSENDSTIQVSNPGPGKTTVVIAHCSVQFSRYMARSLGPDYSVVLIRSHRTQGMDIPVGKTFDDLASDAKSYLDQSENTGPIVLCGYSAGCPLVMELARQLGQDRIKGLVLLDPPIKMVGEEPKLQPIFFRTYKRWRYLFRNFKRKAKAKHTLPATMAALHEQPDSKDLHIEAVEISHGLAISDFRVPRLDQPAHVFLTPGNPSLATGDVLDTHLRRKTCHMLEMKHEELMQRPDAFLNIATALKDLLDQGPPGSG